MAWPFWEGKIRSFDLIRFRIPLIYNSNSLEKLHKLGDTWTLDTWTPIYNQLGNSQKIESGTFGLVELAFNSLHLFWDYNNSFRD